jgi:tetratricopeptide (TPR) repeat protein
MLPVVGALLLAATPPAQDWHELSSTHFTLRTNLDTDTAMRAAVEIARTRSALVAAMWPPVREVGIEPVDIIVFKDRTEFEHYAGDGSRGLYSHSALPPRIILWGSPERWEQRLGPAEMLPPSNPRRPATVGQDELSVHLQYVQTGSSSVLRHELAHHVASAVYPRLPLWFSEGQAQFLESIKLSEDGRTATVGLINPTAWREYRRIRAIDLRDVLRWTMPLTGLSQSESMGLYGGAWQLYEWLFTTHRTSLRCLQEQLAARVPIADGWAHCFPDIVADQLGPVLWEFSRNGTPGLSEIAIPPLGLEVKVRPLTEAELHLLHAQVALAAPRREDLLKEVAIELNQALALDPASVGVLQLVAPLVSPQRRLEDAHRAVLAHPEDGWAWLLLADALWDTAGSAAERERAYRRAAELLPDSPLVLARTARNLLSRDERAQALVLAERAAQLAPWNGEVLAIDALALAAAGRCGEGLGVALQARVLLAGATGLSRALEVGLARACPAQDTPDGGASSAPR